MRHPSRPCRFIFVPDHPLGLIIEAVSPKGRDAFARYRKRLKDELEPGSTMVTGACLVDDRQRYVFCGSNLGPDLLGALASWAAEVESELPAATGLIDAGVARVDLDLKDDEAIRGVDLDVAEVHREPALWEELLEPSYAGVSAVLESVQPGQRLWFWLWPDAWEDVSPLLVQPIASDPNRDRIDHLIALTLDGMPDEACSGVCVPVDDGRLQLLAPDVSPMLLELLADWVKEHVEEYPGLARLRDCQLLLTGASGTVEQVFEDPALWEGVPSPTPPGTMAATAAVLDGLARGADAWFWLGRAGDASFLSLYPVDEDPDGEAFHEQVATLFDRYPESVKGALFGTVRRLDTGKLLFSTGEAKAKQWGHAAKAILDAHAEAWPTLRQLETAHLVQVDDDGQITQAFPVGR